MKKVIAMLLALIACATLLAGCGGPEKGHVTITSGAGYVIEYDYIGKGEEIEIYNYQMTQVADRIESLGTLMEND